MSIENLKRFSPFLIAIVSILGFRIILLNSPGLPQKASDFIGTFHILDDYKQQENDRLQNIIDYQKILASNNTDLILGPSVMRTVLNMKLLNKYARLVTVDNFTPLDLNRYNNLLDSKSIKSTTLMLSLLDFSNLNFAYTHGARKSLFTSLSTLSILLPYAKDSSARLQIENHFRYILFPEERVVQALTTLKTIYLVQQGIQIPPPKNLIDEFIFNESHFQIQVESLKQTLSDLKSKPFNIVLLPMNKSCHIGKSLEALNQLTNEFKQLERNFEHITFYNYNNGFFSEEDFTDCGHLSNNPKTRAKVTQFSKEIAQIYKE